MTATPRTAAFALGLCLAACVAPTQPAPPFATAPSDAAVAAALAGRVNDPDLPEMAIRPSADDTATPSCRASFRADTVSVTQQPVHDAEQGYRVQVASAYAVTRLVGASAPAASLYDCFGDGASAGPADWQRGAVQRLTGAAEITWEGRYWLLQVGDEYVPLPPGPTHPFTVRELAAPG